MENNFFIDVDGIAVHGRLEKPEILSEKFPLMILVPGLTGHMDEAHIVRIKDEALSCGYACLCVELYGHGQSKGDFRDHTIELWVNELISVVKMVSGWNFVSKIVLAGHSQGGLTAMLAAPELQPLLCGLILLSPATSIVDACRKGDFFGGSFDPLNLPETVCFWDKYYVDRPYFAYAQTIDVDAAIAGYTGDVLLVHGTKDPEVPATCSTDAAAKYRHAELFLCEGDTHCYDLHIDQVVDTIAKWLRGKD